MTAAHRENPALRRGWVPDATRAVGNEGKSWRVVMCGSLSCLSYAAVLTSSKNRHLLDDMRVDGLLLWE